MGLPPWMVYDGKTMEKPMIKMDDITAVATPFQETSISIHFHRLVQSVSSPKLPGDPGTLPGAHHDGLEARGGTKLIAAASTLRILGAGELGNWFFDGFPGDVHRFPLICNRKMCAKSRRSAKNHENIMDLRERHLFLFIYYSFMIHPLEM